MNLLFESTIIGIISAICGFIYIKIIENIPYKNYIPCIFYIIGFLVYFIYHINDFRSIYCITGLCNKRIGNIVIYDDNNINENNNINDIINNDNIVNNDNGAFEPFISSKTFIDRKEGYVFKTGDRGTGYYLEDSMNTNIRNP